jgi:hypothetical protein
MNTWTGWIIGAYPGTRPKWPMAIKMLLFPLASGVQPFMQPAAAWPDRSAGLSAWVDWSGICAAPLSIPNNMHVQICSVQVCIYRLGVCAGLCKCRRKRINISAKCTHLKTNMCGFLWFGNQSWISLHSITTGNPGLLRYLCWLITCGNRLMTTHGGMLWRSPNNSPHHCVGF